MPTTKNELTKRSGKRSLLAAIGGLSAGIALLFLMPFLVWMVVVWLMFQIPNGSTAVYDGFHIKGARGSGHRLTVSSPLPTNFFVLIDGEAIPIDEVTPEHLLSVGFKPDPMYVNGYAEGVGDPGTTSSARFDSLDRLVRLYMLEYVPISFSSSKDGPWLKLPVDFDEVKQQFGKPNEWRYTYPSRWI